jgi:hypothetical protein
MAHPKVSQKRAKALSSSLLLILLAIISFTGNWWPGIMLVVGLPLSFRQFLLGRNYDMGLSLTLFIGAFIVSSGYEISWNTLLPVLFTIGAIYTLAREFITPFPTTEAEDEESLSKEIEEEDLHQ